MRAQGIQRGRSLVVSQSRLAYDPFDQFVARRRHDEIRDLMRQVSDYPAARNHERALLESPLRGDGRMMLANLARAHRREIFVATVGARGSAGRHRTILLKDLRLFGSKFIEEDHVWVVYNRLWERIEPFYQGEAAVLVGTAVEYSRRNGTSDYTLELEYATKLRMPTKNAPPTNKQSSLVVPLCCESEATAAI